MKQSGLLNTKKSESIMGNNQNPLFLSIFQPNVKNQLQMKSDFGFILLFIFMLSFSGVNSFSTAQENNNELIDPTVDVANLTPEYYSELTLPPLSVFLEAAESSYKVGSLKATKEEEEGSLLSSKREWMNTLRAVGDYKFGNSNINIITQSSNFTNTYNAGASISVPLDVIYDRKNRIRKQQARVNKADFDVKQAIEELKLLIAETYITAIQQMNTLKVRAESKELSDADVKMSETNYLNGNLELSELNYRKSMQATAIANYETTRAELNKAILHLELLTNVKILKKQ
ncbi:MAG TPA: TolC family protein [Bacteroidales bacterium]